MKDTTTPNYYDCFVDSLLSLPPKVRTALLNAVYPVAPNGNTYHYLYDCYSDLDNPFGVFIHQLLDEHQLALD